MHAQIKKSKGVTIETSKLKLSALVSALLYSSAILWRETVSKSCDYIQISAAAYSLYVDHDKELFVKPRVTYLHV